MAASRTLRTNSDQMHLERLLDILQGDTAVLNLMHTHARLLVPVLQELLVRGDLEEMAELRAVLQILSDVGHLELPLGKHRVEP